MGIDATGQDVGECKHEHVRPDVFDQALGVTCTDCNTGLAWCWGDTHCSEELWNRACPNEPEAKPCAQSRPDVCAICGERMM